METENEVYQIDVKKIMDEIYKEISEKHLTDDLPSFEDVTEVQGDDIVFDSTELLKAVSSMNGSYQLTPYFSLTGNPIKVLFKRLVRKLNKFLLVYLSNQQTQFNTSSVQAQNQVYARLKVCDSDHEQIALLKQNIKELQIRINELERK